MSDGEVEAVHHHPLMGPENVLRKAALVLALAAWSTESAAAAASPLGLHSEIEVTSPQVLASQMLQRTQMRVDEVLLQQWCTTRQVDAR